MVVRAADRRRCPIDLTMAGQFITLPSAPNTGAAQLGAALAAASGDYMQQTLRRQAIADQRAREDELMARQRANQLSDLAVARGNQLTDVASQRNFDRERDAARLRNSLTLNHSESDLAIYRSAIQALINEHRLTPEDARDPAKFHAAFDQAQKDGLFQRYANLLQTPGPDGKPFLNVADIGDKAKVDAAQESYGEFMAHQTALKVGQSQNMQAYANRLSDENMRLGQEADKLDFILSQSPDQAIPITPQDVQAEAARLANTAAGPGKVATPAAIAAAHDQALQNLRQRQVEIYNEAKPRLQQQVSLLRSRIRENAISLADQAKKGFAPAGAAPLASAFQAPGATAPLAPPSGARAAALASLLPGGATPGVPAATPGPTQALFANPTNNPTIDAGNTALREQQAAQTQAALNAELQNNQALKQNLAQAQSQMAPSAGGLFADPSGMGGYSGMAADPVGGAQSASSLLQAIAASDAKIQALRTQQLGAPVAGASAPSLNTVNGSTPVSQIPSGAPSIPPGMDDFSQ